MVSADFSQDTKKTRSISYKCILDGEQESTSIYDGDDFCPESDSQHISFVISNTFKKPVIRKVSIFCYIHMETINNKTSNALTLRRGVLQINKRNFINDFNSIHIDYKIKNKYTVLNITSGLIEDNNYQLSIRGKKLVLILSEKKEIERPLHVHNLTRNVIDKTSYERLQSYEIELPKSNYQIIKTNLNTSINSLKIILGKRTEIQEDTITEHLIMRRREMS